VLAEVAAGRLNPLIGLSLPLAEASRAQEALETASVSGKVVLRP